MRVIVGKSPDRFAVRHCLHKNIVPQNPVALAFVIEFVDDFHTNQVRL
jgi:hypothetical protein